MARDANAQVAVNLYNGLVQAHQLTAATAWHGIAQVPAITEKGKIEMVALGYNTGRGRTDDLAIGLSRPDHK